MNADPPAGEGERRLRVLLVCSNGGHLAQLSKLKPWWSRHERLWVTFEKADAQAMLASENTRWAHFPTTRNLPNALRNMRLARRVLAEYRPDVIISSGAGVAVPFFVLGRLAGITTVYLEVFDRIDSATLTGRMCAPLSDLFCLQWDQQLEQYPGGTVVGPVFVL